MEGDVFNKAIRHVIDRLLIWFDANARSMPWREKPSPYGTWISEIMLQQTQVSTVVPYWNRWMSRFPDVNALADADLSEVFENWAGLGYYRRARFLHQAAKQLVDQKKGSLPGTLEEWLALPGIGRYSAGAICSIAFNQAKPILDGNIVRILSRLFGIDEMASGTRRAFWNLSEMLIQECDHFFADQKNHCARFNQSMMELGAVICLPRSPLCQACPVQSFCFAFKNQRVSSLPVLPRREPVTQLWNAALIVQRSNLFALEKGREDGWNAGLWKFPTFDLTPGSSRKSIEKVIAPFVLEKKNKEPILSFTHTITKHRIRLEVYHALLRQEDEDSLLSTLLVWTDLTKLSKLAMSSANRRIANHLRDSVLPHI